MPKYRCRSGFTLVELAIVLTIIGLLAGITIPNYMNFAEKAKESAVKENMHLFQIAMEDYSITFAGTYPGPGEEAALLNLMPNASAPLNPFTKVPTNLVWNGDPGTQGQISITNLAGGGYLIKGYGANGILSSTLQLGD